jgi:hypothetical protein
MFIGFFNSIFQQIGRIGINTSIKNSHEPYIYQFHGLFTQIFGTYPLSNINMSRIYSRVWIKYYLNFFKYMQYVAIYIFSKIGEDK